MLDYRAYAEPHDSFYIGSDVFYTYIVSNGDWRLRIRQRSEEGYFEAAGELRERLLTGKFPGKIREQFESVLEYFGQNPFIVRSSSFLEDGFGNAFAGKYESVFCVNRGNMAERLEAFENAVRQVYASTMDRSALEYRLRRGLAGKDEQMAILVQRVSGSYEDYPRLSNLDRPEITVYTSAAQKHRFSQRNVDVLDCRENRYKEVRLEQLLDVLPLWYKRMVMEHDYEAERMLSDRGIYRDVWFVSCQRLLENRVFTGLMQRILKTLERVYGTAVDIEYAINMDKDGDFVINLLQCRPLYLGGESEEVKLEGIELKGTLFDVRDASMGTSKKRKVDVIVQIDPALYGAFPYAQKHKVAEAVGSINRYYSGSGKNLLLMTPGRIGTSSPELGFGQPGGLYARTQLRKPHVPGHG